MIDSDGVFLDGAARSMVQNAIDYMNDASALLAMGRWRGAFALATLALEEVGKAWALHRTVGDTDERLRTYRRVSRDHAGKIMYARQMGALAEGLSEGVVDVGKWFSDDHEFRGEYDHDIRMLGMYVDLDLKERKTIGGPGSIDESAAQEQCATAARLVVTAARIYGLAACGHRETSTEAGDNCGG